MRGILLLLFGAVVAGCSASPLVPIPPGPSPTIDGAPATDRAPSLRADIAVPWRIDAQNQVRVHLSQVPGPLLLVAELTPQPVLDQVEPLLPPGADPGAPPEPVRGWLAVRQVVPDTAEAAFSFPAWLFAADRGGLPITGWELRLTLIDRIDAYPLAGARDLGPRYSIAPDAITAAQTWVLTEADQLDVDAGLPDSALVIPASSAGAYLYYPSGMVHARIVLVADRNLQFEERG